MLSAVGDKLKAKEKKGNIHLATYQGTDAGSFAEPVTERTCSLRKAFLICRERLSNFKRPLVLT